MERIAKRKTEKFVKTIQYIYKTKYNCTFEHCVIDLNTNIFNYFLKDWFFLDITAIYIVQFQLVF